jgi:glycosyltransferase involved in cell wall biosynthesis
VPEAAAPRFSIVVPAYNAASTLAETLDALLAQELSAWECVIVDDGSTDRTLEIARDYEKRDRRFRAVHQANSGTAGAYNRGVGEAHGEYVVMCSADDILLPEHLSTFGSFMDSNPGYDIYSSNGYLWHPGESRDLIYYDTRSREPHSKSLADVIRVCFYSVGAVFRRELLAVTGGFRSETFGEDYDFWLRSMALGARHRFIPAPLSMFRTTPSQKSANLEAMYRSDIRLVTELRDTYPLSDEERSAVDENVAERHRLIDGLHHGPLHWLRTRVEPIAVALIGRPRARRIWQMIKSVARVSSRVDVRGVPR